MNTKKLSTVPIDENFTGENRYFVAVHGESVKKVDASNFETPSEKLLPDVTSDNNGYILKVVDGVWTAVDPATNVG